MNRKLFTGLVFMMLFSIVGIIWVQIRWINKAVGIRNENFDYYVTASIREAAEALESSWRMNSFFDGFLFSSVQEDDTSANVSGYLSMNSFTTGSDGTVRIQITNQSFTRNPGEEPVITVHDTTYTTDSSRVIMATPGKPGEVIILDRGGESGSRGNYVSQEELVRWANRRSNEMRTMSDQMIAELYQKEKSIKISKEEVQYALNRAFMFSPVQPSYEFAIIRDGKVEDGNFRKTGRNEFLRSKYRVALFQDNIVRPDLMISLVFPGRTTYVLGSMAWMLAGSLLFSLIILATFALSLFFIIRQKKISEMKSDFINNMTHEFKTPIATISLAADTITNPRVIKDEQSVRHFVSMIKKENSRMDKKVETILQLASLDRKEIHFRFENLSLHEVIHHAVETIDIIIRQKNGIVTMNLNAREHVIRGDSEHIFNLVNNLLDNAIKYSPESPEILIETRNDNEGVLMSVTDKGIGMTKSVQSKIFERFYRQASGKVHDVKGFGVGLNYVKAIVEAHKGTITVTSEPGKGSRFDVYLPFNPENQG
jgi:two-component system phosphate regulon sensor histidine kinase PhoR